MNPACLTKNGTRHPPLKFGLLFSCWVGESFKHTAAPITSMYPNQQLSIPILLVYGEKDIVGNKGVNNLPLRRLFSDIDERRHPGGHRVPTSDEWVAIIKNWILSSTGSNGRLKMKL
ncbi:hypothetical protein DL93DRAFT_153433 [Clavulina sp. PMI_390]|nr:hypothetical protein DL93DRAFT_153433 [Clavulina sp. PMI_390]